MQITIRNRKILRALGFTTFTRGAYISMPLSLWWLVAKQRAIAALRGK